MYVGQSAGDVCRPDAVCKPDCWVMYVSQSAG